MKDNHFKKIILGLIIAGITSVIVLIIITIVLYQQTSMITFIEKEAW